MRRRTAATSAVWSVVLFWARFGINSVVFLIIARWLSVAEIGAYGAAYAVIQVIQSAQLTGLPEAVIRRRREDITVSTAFWLSLTLGAVIATLLYLAAPLTSWALKSELVGHFFRVLAIVPFLNGIGAISEAMIRSQLRMRSLAVRTVVALSLSGATAVWMAWSGWGGWALVALTITNNAIATLLNMLMARWVPQWQFSGLEARSLIRDGVHIAARNVVGASINPTTQFVVTLFLGAAAGGFYAIALRIAALISSISMMPAQYTALPLFARIDDPDKKIKGFLDAAGVTSLISAPIYLGALVTAPPLFHILLGNNGAAAAPVAQGLLFHSPALVISNLGIPMLVVAGRARWALLIGLAQAVVNVPIAVAAAHVSVEFVAWSYGFLSFAFIPVMLVCLKKSSSVPPVPVAAHVFRPWAAALIMAVAVALMLRLLPGSYGALSRLALATLVGGLLYPMLLTLFARPQLANVVRAVRSLYAKKRSGA